VEGEEGKICQKAKRATLLFVLPIAGDPADQGSGEGVLHEGEEQSASERATPEAGESQQ
jgi:hypothetical protein